MREELVCVFTFPIDFEEVKEKIGLKWWIRRIRHSWPRVTLFTVDEPTPLANSIDYGKWVSELPGRIQSVLFARSLHFSSIEELSEHQEDYSFLIVMICMTCGTLLHWRNRCLGEVPASLQNYIDYQAYGLDLDSGMLISNQRGFLNSLLNLPVHYYWQIFYFTGVVWIAPIFLERIDYMKKIRSYTQYLVCGKGTVYSINDFRLL